jgi:hypothetical protein
MRTKGDFLVSSSSLSIHGVRTFAITDHVAYMIHGDIIGRLVKNLIASDFDQYSLNI